MGSKRVILPTLALSVLLAGFCLYLTVQPTEVRARPGASAPVSTGIASVSFVEGEALVRSQDGAWVPLRKGDVLSVGDAVRTGAQGRAELLLQNRRGRLRLDRGTELRLKGEKRERGPVAVGGRITSGSVWAALSRLSATDAPFVLDTPTVWAAAKGTVFRVHVLEDDWVRVSVYEGTAEAGYVGGEGEQASDEWMDLREVSVGQALKFVPGKPPVLEKIDLRSDWNDGWHRQDSVAEIPVQASRREAVRKALIRDLHDLNPDLYLSVEVELTGLEEQARRFRLEEARIRKIKIRSDTWDQLGAANKVDVLNETFSVLKQRYPNITRSVILEFDDGRPDLELKYALALKG